MKRQTHPFLHYCDGPWVIGEKGRPAGEEGGLAVHRLEHTGERQERCPGWEGTVAEDSERTCLFWFFPPFLRR